MNETIHQLSNRLQNSRKKRYIYMHMNKNSLQLFNSLQENNPTSHLKRIRSSISRQLKTGCFKSEPLLGMDSTQRAPGQEFSGLCLFWKIFSIAKRERSTPNTTNSIAGLNNMTFHMPITNHLLCLSGHLYLLIEYSIQVLLTNLGLMTSTELYWYSP